VKKQWLGGPLLGYLRRELQRFKRNQHESSPPQKKFQLGIILVQLKAIPHFIAQAKATIPDRVIELVLKAGIRPFRIVIIIWRTHINRSRLATHSLVYDVD